MLFRKTILFFWFLKITIDFFWFLSENCEDQWVKRMGKSPAQDYAEFYNFIYFWLQFTPNICVNQRIMEI